jgi:hypothetical protein
MKDLKEYFYGLIGWNRNIDNLVKESTKTITEWTRSSSGTDLFRAINKKNILIGKFYFIQYFYNGNRIWCPIFTIEFKIYKKKNILYAINLDYLPYAFKIYFFDLIWKTHKDIIKRNEDINNTKTELKFQDITFELIYKLLKNNGKHEYSITAYDIKKILKIYSVSTNVVPTFLMLSTRNMNKASMKELILSAKDKDKEKLEDILIQFDKLIEGYKLDDKEYYEKLKNFEKLFKLFED